MKKRLVYGLVLFVLVLPAFSGSLGARTPAAVVVELALGDSSAALAPCSGVSIHAHAVRLDERLVGKLFPAENDTNDVYVSPGLQSLEDASTILLLRTPRTCRLVFGRRRGRIPTHWAKRFAEGAARRWRVDDDGSIHLAGGHELSLYPGTVAGPIIRAGSALRVFNYGRLELYQGRHPPRTKSVGVDGAAAVHFAGPGDVARFRLHTSQAGSFIIERTPGDMPWLAMRIGMSEADLSPRGMLAMPAGGEALMKMRYDGFGPRDMEIGFLFTPDIPISCRLHVET